MLQFLHPSRLWSFVVQARGTHLRLVGRGKLSLSLSLSRKGQSGMKLATRSLNARFAATVVTRQAAADKLVALVEVSIITTSKWAGALACRAVQARRMQRASCRHVTVSARPAQRSLDAVPLTAGMGAAEAPPLRGGRELKRS